MAKSTPVEPDHMALQVGACAPSGTIMAVRRSMSHKITDVELLRGIAVLFIIVHHIPDNLIIWRNAAFDGLFHYFGFWTGVDLFFAISGFVIARSLLSTLKACNTNREFFKATLSFWIRRAWRLLPAAWLWLALMLLAPAVFNRSSAFGSIEVNFWAAVAGVLNFANFRFAYKFMHEYYGTSFVYWSLSLEEQFYLLLPIAVFLFRRWLAVPLVILVLIQFFSLRTPLLMVVRTDAILLGVLLAMWSQQLSYRLVEPRCLATSRLARVAVVALLLVCVAALGANRFSMMSNRIGLIALLSAMLVLIASYNRDYLWQEGVAKRMMVWVGSRSYGLYLIHIPVYCLTREIWYRLAPTGIVFDNAYTLRFILTAAVLLLLLSELNYRFVEAPLRIYGVRVAERFMKT